MVWAQRYFVPVPQVPPAVSIGSAQFTPFPPKLDELIGGENNDVAVDETKDFDGDELRREEVVEFVDADLEERVTKEVGGQPRAARFATGSADVRAPPY